MSARVYEFSWEFEDAAETPVLVVASVSGRDEEWSPQAMSPPESREVEIEVRRYFCPNADHMGCKGCEYVDVTHLASEGWLDGMRGVALECDDDEQEDYR